MRVSFLLLPLLLTTPALAQDGAAPEQQPLSVVGFKWTKVRQVVVAAVNTGGTTPAAALTRADKNFERNRRVNDPAGVRDPNADTLDARSAAMDRNVREARAAEQSKSVDGYEYRARLQNAGAKAVEVVFWEYQFKETAAPANVSRRQFLCGVQIKPGKDKELLGFTLAGPGDVISANSLDRKAAKLFDEQVVVNRVEYSDGTIWQRRGWNFGEVRGAVARAVATPWGGEMCRAL